MIYTVTLNPALDYAVTIPEFIQGRVNRPIKETVLSGGKGINVSVVLKNLGLDSVTYGFLAGFTGHKIEADVKEHGCYTDFIYIEEGMSRINIKLLGDSDTDINGSGPLIQEEKLDLLMGKFDTLQKEDILVLAGSLPRGVKEDIYAQIMKRIQGKKIRVIVDATKNLLLPALPYRPFLIKPNHHELGEIFGITLNDKEEVEKYAKKLIELGAQNVLVSMAGKGAVLVLESGEVLKMEAPKGKLINPVGAGDSMVAGFLCGYLQSKDFKEAFKMGVYTGSASAFSDKLATAEDVLKLIDEKK